MEVTVPIAKTLAQTFLNCSSETEITHVPHWGRFSQLSSCVPKDKSYAYQAIWICMESRKGQCPNSTSRVLLSLMNFYVLGLYIFSLQPPLSYHKHPECAAPALFSFLWFIPSALELSMYRISDMLHCKLAYVPAEIERTANTISFEDWL